METIGFGGSCHWCTEAIFSSLIGVAEVQQGWIASELENTAYAEAVLLTFDPALISLQTLVSIHLYTHSCTSNHSMRAKYRSAVYARTRQELLTVKEVLQLLQQDYPNPIITQALRLQHFKLNTEEFLNYYYKDPGKPFCENIVNPKLKLLLQQFATVVDQEKLKHLRD
jgi:peptide-methionine (S)-S-oxide reductase